MILRPCPFCGHDVEKHGLRDPQAPVSRKKTQPIYRVVCVKCGAWGPNGSTVAEARASWNNRIRDHTHLSAVK